MVSAVVQAYNGRLFAETPAGSRGQGHNHWSGDHGAKPIKFKTF